MAIISMRKMTLVGLRDDRQKILKELSRLRVTEIKKTDDIDNTVNLSYAEGKDALISKMANLSFCMDLIKTATKFAEKQQKTTAKYKLEAPATRSTVVYSKGTDLPVVVGKKKIKSQTLAQNLGTLIDNINFISDNPIKKEPFLKPIEYVPFDEFCAIEDKIGDIDAVINFLKDKNKILVETKSELIRAAAKLEQLTPYKDIDAPFSLFKDTKSVAILLGTIPREKAESLDEVRREVAQDIDIELFEGGKTQAIAVICPIESKSQLLSALSNIDFAACSIESDKTASQIIEETNDSIRLANDAVFKVYYEILTRSQALHDIKRLYDFYALELKKLEISEELKCTASTFVLEAWLPFDATNKVKETLERVSSVALIEFEDPKEDEIVPTLARNKNIVKPYEAVTNMYSAPKYGEIDPNPFVAIFFFLFFGVMISDAGYGIFLTIAALIIIKITKPRLDHGQGMMYYLILMGGISTIFWGILFGGWFGIELTDTNPIGRFLLAISWFSPLEEPLMMLGLSLALGVIQIMFGMGIQAAAYFKAGKPLDAVLEIFTWYAVFIGIGLFALKLVLKSVIVGYIGIAMLAIGVVGLLIAGGRGKKGFKMALGGLGKLYGIVNFLSDILSYSRLFGLGLVTGVVGMVINLIAGVIIDLIPFYIGYVFAIPVLIGGHIFNIAINTLGAYVHNCRLQYIEFFSRFYSGAGHLFKPLGSTNKYTNIE